MMLDDHTYNLMLQTVQENKSLWRIKNHYKKDAGDCNKCNEFWEKLGKDKEKHIKDLTDLLKGHFENIG